MIWRKGLSEIKVPTVKCFIITLQVDRPTWHKKRTAFLDESLSETLIFENKFRLWNSDFAKRRFKKKTLKKSDV